MVKETGVNFLTMANYQHNEIKIEETKNVLNLEI